MPYSCKILLDSISETEKRITTFEITFPRIVLAEFNTHRMFSRNSASSRAIPFKKQIKRVVDDPFIPEKFPLNAKGMQPIKYVEKESKTYKILANRWIDIRDLILWEVGKMYSCLDPLYNPEIGVQKIYKDWDWQNDENPEPSVHKQIINRLLEPFMWHTVIVTATEFDNFFKLRCDKNAQYEIRRIADLMYEAYHAFDNEKWDSVVRHNKPGDLTINGVIDDGWSAIKPQKLKVGEWHCPLVYEEDELAILYYISKQDTENGEYQRSVQYKNFKSPEIGSLDSGSDEELYNELIETKKKISVARCARVSYLTHDGKRDIEKDLELFKRLRTSGHWSPFEHVATPYFVDAIMRQSYWNQAKTLLEHDSDDNVRSGNFIGWKQFRKEFADENCANFRKEN